MVGDRKIVIQGSQESKGREKKKRKNRYSSIRIDYITIFHGVFKK